MNLSLTNTKLCAVVDDEDYPVLSRCTWSISNNGYARTTITHNKKYIQISLHRFVHGAFPIGTKKEIDHINRNKLDNRKQNLRLVEKTINQRNKPKRKNTSSRYMGVSWDRYAKKWKSQIRYCGKCVHLGNFIDEIEASDAYQCALRSIELDD